MSKILLKVKTKTGQIVLDGLNSESSLGALKNELHSRTGILPEKIKLKYGFPPRPLEGPDNVLLGGLGLKSGDGLIAEELESAPAAPAPAPAPKEITNNLGQFQGALLMRRVVPSDNSCLFTSIGFVLEGQVDTSCGQYMRQVIADQVRKQQELYSEAFLGKPNSEYCEWIKKPETWGGAIELAVLSQFYKIEIAVVDTINAVINRFGEDMSYPYRVFLIYDGIHYDPLYKETHDGSIQTMFPSSNEKILLEAAELANEAKSSRQFTDLARFTLRCLVCREMLVGQTQAQEHAQKTGHTNFGEVAS